MSNITFTLSDVLWALGGIITLAGVVRIYKEFSVRPKVDDHERRIAALEEEQEAHKSDLQVLTKGLFALVNHEIDGNGIDGLKRARDELQEHLADK